VADVTISVPSAEPSIGRFMSLGRGSLASVALFRHGGAHRDPAEEWTETPWAVFTTSGAWRFHSSTAAGPADSRRAIVAGSGVAYRCGHEDRRPTDRTIALDLASWSAADPTAAGPRLAGRAAFVDVTPEVHRARTILVAEALRVGEDTRLRLDLAAADLLGALLRSLAGAIMPRHPGEPDAVDAALACMRNRLADEALDLATLAGAAALSPFHFARLFRDRVGEPPVRHLRRLRLERAALLLRETRRPITEIALDAGFGSLSNFVTTFRLAYGLSPDRWRRARTFRRD
jgi:AraC-like DNA-binding protein